MTAFLCVHRWRALLKIVGPFYLLIPHCSFNETVRQELTHQCVLEELTRTVNLVLIEFLFDRVKSQIRQLTRAAYMLIVGG